MTYNTNNEWKQIVHIKRWEEYVVPDYIAE